MSQIEKKLIHNKSITLIAAVSKNNGIGLNNKLLWYNKDDLKRFKELTIGHSIIMGRKTFESLPNGALPNRKNIVLTREKNYSNKNIFVANNINDAIQLTKNDSNPFIIGGGEIYSLFFEIAQKIELTKIDKFFKADTFFPKIEEKEWEIMSEKICLKNENNLYNYKFITYKRSKVK
ncbi:MAG: diacylglycerol kinase [Flavobacteriaceae bacterium]|nr:diacylglycerol kinase [Flavobacteriaceae bacterium]|tara:strand:+ start:1302 stop:1832 length:531 start_codon:yes stop_codon:yes gene_type:complete